MPMKKQQFRFRIPWISGPKQRSRCLNQLDTHTSIQRPPFRPPGIASAPTQPPPASAQLHGTPCSEPQQLLTSHPPPPPQSPASSVILESPMSSPSEPPSRSSPSHVSIIKVPPTNPSAAEKNTKPHSEPKMKSPMKAPLETQTKSHQSKTKAKEKLIKLGKANDIKHGQSIQRQNTELHTASTSKVQSKDKNAFHTKVSEADTVERKVMFATSNPSKKDIKVVNSASTTTKEDASNFDHKLGTVNTTKLMDEKTVSVMTLAGENRGATMHVADSNTQSTRKKGSIPKQGEGEGEENRSTEKAYVNSNIQNMNNSFMLHGSINGRDPGVRVILPQQPQRDDERGLENPKAKSEVKINRAERVAYQPVVRRRCLRGLFMEPSDSDPDNPNKPRRHGCKFSCGEVRKDNDTGIV